MTWRQRGARRRSVDRSFLSLFFAYPSVQWSHGGHCQSSHFRSFCALNNLCSETPNGGILQSNCLGSNTWHLSSYIPTAPPVLPYSSSPISSHPKQESSPDDYSLSTADKTIS